MGPSPTSSGKPFGPGWALVGDAGYTKDPQGISDAFRDAELCSTAGTVSPAEFFNPEHVGRIMSHKAA